jgi:3-hydroxy-3-methylglutaryl CoA synthase
MFWKKKQEFYYDVDLSFDNINKTFIEFDKAINELSKTAKSLRKDIDYLLDFIDND